MSSHLPIELVIKALDNVTSAGETYKIKTILYNASPEWDTYVRMCDALLLDKFSNDNIDVLIRAGIIKRPEEEWSQYCTERLNEIAATKNYVKHAMMKDHYDETVPRSNEEVIAWKTMSTKIKQMTLDRELKDYFNKD